MFLESTGPAVRRVFRAAQPLVRRTGSLVLPLLLGFGMACSGHKTSLSDPGNPPTITSQPVDTTTISGRSVSLTVGAEGAPTLRYQWTKDGVSVLGALSATYTISDPQPYHAGDYAVTITNPNGTIQSATAHLTVRSTVAFVAPVAVAVDGSGNLFVSDMGDHTIWKVDTANHKTLVAGASGIPGSTDGLSGAARFNSPGGLAVDGSGNLFVADSGNHTLRKVAPDGTVTTLAGSAGLAGSADGLGAAARFNTPFGLALDSAGLLYVADTLNHTLRTVATDGTVSTFAGQAGTPGRVDGAAASARFSQPNALAFAPDGSLVVADYGNSAIRTVTPSGTVATLAGKADSHGWADGAAASALFNLPVGLVVDSTNTVWVADTHNHVVRKIATGTVSTPAGSGTTSGNADGTGSTGFFKLPCGIALLPGGDFVVADTGNGQLRRVTAAGVVTTYIEP